MKNYQVIQKDIRWEPPRVTVLQEFDNQIDALNYLEEAGGWYRDVLNRLEFHVHPLSYFKDKCRKHECWNCGITYIRPVILCGYTRNITGERTWYCPRCGKRSAFASTVFPTPNFTHA